MVQRYNPDYVMHAARFAPFARENEHGEYVKFSDHEALVSELASSRQINVQTLQVKLTMAETIKELTDRVERLSGMLTESRVATKSAEERADALAVENAALKDVFGPGEAVVNFLSIALRHTKYDYIDLPDVALAFKMSLPETPATDAALAAIRTESHIAGVEAAANRIGVISLKYNPGQKHELIKAIDREVIKYATELREAK
ncbi:TPA: hypothetical protein SLN38_000500 [Serratia marcescens]|nr:hypothetical protein [Serratia marcescens]